MLREKKRKPRSAWLFTLRAIELSPSSSHAGGSASFDPEKMSDYHFPYSCIVSIAVAGALLGNLVLFRKLLTRAEG